MNTQTIYCDQQRQRCPSPMKCKEKCDFNCSTSTKLETGNSDFSNPGYPFTWLDEILNFWDDLSWWQAVLFVFGIVAVCGMVAGVLTGYSK